MQALSVAVSRLASFALEPLAHGDIKPANIVVIRENDGFHIGIVDYDTVFSLRHPRTFPIPGTKGYSAPELSRPHASTFHGRADVFSFGAIAEKMAPDLLSRSASFAQLVAACLRNDPFDRPSPSQLPGLVADALYTPVPPFANGPCMQTPSPVNEQGASAPSLTGESPVQTPSFMNGPCAPPQSFMNDESMPTLENSGKERPRSA